MPRRSILWLLAALTTAFAAPPDAAPQEHSFVVIVHADNPTTTIDREDLSKIFLKRVAKWPNGLPAEPIDLTPASPLRILFTSRVHRKSVGAIKAFWQQQIFSGRDVPPPEKSSEAAVTEYVSGHPGAVGYVSPGAALADGVKAVSVQRAASGP